MLSYITSFFNNNNQPESFVLHIEYKKTYLDYIGTAKNAVANIAIDYKDTVSSYINDFIDISLEQFLGNTLTKMVAPKIGKCTNYIISKTASYLDSCVDSYTQSIESDIKTSTEYSDIAQGADPNLFIEDLNSMVIIGDIPQA